MRALMTWVSTLPFVLLFAEASSFVERRGAFISSSVVVEQQQQRQALTGTDSPWVATGWTKGSRDSWVTLCMAKGGKKKRRRKASPVPTPSSAASSVDNKEEDDEKDDDLPEFDLQEDAPPTELDAVIDDLASTSVENSSFLNLSMDNPEVLEVMKGKGGGQTDRPTEDLLKDRSLEKFMEFDEVTKDPSLPMLGDIGKRKETAAPANVASKDEGPSFQFQLPDFIGNLILDDETRKLSFPKILNSGAWAGIILLVLWEIYINSPLFDRAAPMAPVVF